MSFDPRSRRPAGSFSHETHRVHDYSQLVRRWKKVARASGLKLEPFAQAGDFTLYHLMTRPAAEGKKGGLYLSAGIHGDEPAPPEALAQWAETHLPLLARGRELPLFIVPCLNPYGLVHNRRTDEHGTDLNRVFSAEDVTPVRELKEILGRQQFNCALTLHEDYDAQGVYLYELRRLHRSWGQELLEAVAGFLPPEPRRSIDGRRFKHGLLSMSYSLGKVPGYPEAIYLYKNHAKRAYTFETPSEFSLTRRVRAHLRLIEACAARVVAG